MFINLIRSSLRNLFRNRLFSGINVLALTLGVASLLLVGLYVHYQLTFDREWDNSDRLYRVQFQQIDDNGDTEYTNSLTAEFVGSIAPKVPAFEAMSRYVVWAATFFLEDATIVQEFTYVDPAWLKMFDLDMIEGTAELPDPNSTLLSQKVAQKFFGRDHDVVGQTLSLTLHSQQREVIVRGVYRDFPEKSAIEMPMLLDYDNVLAMYRRHIDNTWGIVFSESFVMLQKGVSVEEAERQLELVDLGVEESEKVWSMYPARYDLQPLTEMHTTLVNPRVFPTDVAGRDLWVMIGIGAIILLLAVVNFTMLTIGRSSSRMREVGVRKVLGAGRQEIGLVFWVETAMLSLLAVVAGLLVVELISPLFETLSGVQVSPGFDIITLGLCVGIWLLTTVLSGIYPTLNMMTLPLIPTLRGSVRPRGRTGLRRGMLTVQLAVSVGMIVAALVMTRQFQYIQNMNLGYAGEQIVVLDANAKSTLAHDASQRLRNALATEPGVLGVTEVSCSFGRPWNMTGWNTDAYKDVTFWYNIVDPEFQNVAGLEFVAGQGFNRTDEGRKDLVVVNEAFVKSTGFTTPVEAIGQSVPELIPDAVIAGVVKDFHFNDLYFEIEPLILVLDDDAIGTRNWTWVQQGSSSNTGFILIRLGEQNIAKTMNRIESAWSELVPETEYNAKFISDEIQHQYIRDRRWNRIITLSAGLAVLIALLGLVGVSVLQVAARTKEIGIRKVLGATEAKILMLLGREVVLVALIANLIAWPLAWWVLKSWLENFAYHITLNPLLFIGSGVLLVAVALGTVLGLSYGAATLNPANTLRDE